MSRRVVAALVGVLAVLSWAAPAAADPPARLTAAITDPAGVLGSRRAAAQAALDRLRAQTGIALSVVFVPSFGDTSAQRWTDETARLSGMTGGQALLAVAIGDREYAVHAPADPRVTKGEAAAVARNDIEPPLTRGDWSGAVVAAADGFHTAATGSGSFTWVLVLAIVIILAVGGRALLRGRHPPTVVPEDGRADALLVDADDAVRAAGHSVPPDLTEAFRLRGALAAEPPADPAAHRAMAAAIIDRAATAQRLATATTTGATADDTDRRRVALEAAIPAAAKETQDLLSRYAGSRAALISANVDQARARLAFAATALIEARAAGGRTDALAAGRAVEQADRLLAAIGRAADDGVAARVAAVDDFITTRRGAVGIAARTAVSEARRHLALGETGRAQALADQAAQAALTDVDNWPDQPGADAARTAAMLGGILPGGDRRPSTSA
jgi:TLP18.3/Psb32/MOLO-1 phosphatase superfamily protein